MKKHTSLSAKQVLLACLFLLAFSGITIFLFTYKRDEKLFTHLTADLFEDEMKASTLNMHYTIANPTDYGIYDYEAILPTYSAQGQLNSLAATENTIVSLERINSDRLSDSDRYTHTLLLRSLSNSLELSSYAYYWEPLSPSSGMQSQLPILLAEYTLRTKRDVEDYLALLDQTDEYFASLLQYEKEKASAGLIMPASSLDKVKEQCDTIVTKEALDAGTHFLQTTFQERLSLLYQEGEITSEEMEKALVQNDRLLNTVMLPAYIALADGLFLLEDNSVSFSGLAAKPQGTEYYRHLLISETGSHRSLEDIKRLLTEQFDLEYRSIYQLVNDNPNLLTLLKEEDYSDFPYNTASEMLMDLQQRMQTDFPSLKDASLNLPLVTVKAVSPSLQDYCAPAFYLTAPLDDTDNNVIYINEKNSPVGLELYTTLAHEGYPGHLYQTVYSNRSFMARDENKARQLLWYGGYLEGWALYVEFLSFDYAGELVTEHQQPQQALCIQLEKHNRSLQLCLYSLLDIMIHYENASYSQVAKLLEKMGITQPSSASAVYTYIAEEPCNYLKYYLGYLEILELQKAAREKWGDLYSDYLFHTFFLDCGPSDFTSLNEALECYELPASSIDLQSSEKTAWYYAMLSPVPSVLPDLSLLPQHLSSPDGRSGGRQMLCAPSPSGR